jgi:hypothetical protein
MLEQSDVVLTFASLAAESACSKPLQSGILAASAAEQLCVLLFDVHAARYTTAVKLHQQVSCYGLALRLHVLHSLQKQQRMIFELVVHSKTVNIFAC